MIVGLKSLAFPSGLVRCRYCVHRAGTASGKVVMTALRLALVGMDLTNSCIGFDQASRRILHQGQAALLREVAPELGQIFLVQGRDKGLEKPFRVWSCILVVQHHRFLESLDE